MGYYEHMMEYPLIVKYGTPCNLLYSYGVDGLFSSTIYDDLHIKPKPVFSR
jgi:hypothetical protein